MWSINGNYRFFRVKKLVNNVTKYIFHSTDQLLMKILMYKLISLLCCSLLLLVSSCKAPSKLDESIGQTITDVSNGVSSIPPSRVRIVKVSNNQTISSASLVLNDTLALKAVLVDSFGETIMDVPALWSVSGTLNTGDIHAVGGTTGVFANFTASVLGVGTITATIADDSLTNTYNVIGPSASTGAITVSSLLVPDTLAIVSGNAQDGQVGTNLILPLKVKVTTAGNTPIPSLSVSFSVLSGGGQIISAMPVVTDSSGFAEATVRLGGAAGTGSNTFLASMSSGTVTQIIFSANGTPGPATQLSFSTQPSSANVGSQIGVQPVVEIRDSYGNKVTSGSYSVAMAVQTGTGLISGTDTVTSVNGLVLCLQQQ